MFERQEGRARGPRYPRKKCAVPRIKLGHLVAAKEALEDIRAHMASYSEESAQVWVDRITEQGDAVGTFPWSFRIVPEIGAPTIRETFSKPYRIWFEIGEDDVHIMVVFHGSRQVPP